MNATIPTPSAPEVDKFKQSHITSTSLFVDYGCLRPRLEFGVDLRWAKDSCHMRRCAAHMSGPDFGAWFRVADSPLLHCRTYRMQHRQIRFPWTANSLKSARSEFLRQRHQKHDNDSAS